MFEFPKSVIDFNQNWRETAKVARPFVKDENGISKRKRGDLTRLGMRYSGIPTRKRNRVGRGKTVKNFNLQVEGLSKLALI